MSSLAAFILFLLSAAFIVNVFKGTATQWLTAKFTGKAA